MNKELYYKEITDFSDDISFLKDKSILITGATGLIGSYLADVIMSKNNNFDLNCHIYVLGRNEDKLKKRFSIYSNNQLFSILCHDIEAPLSLKDKINFIVHLASNTNPFLYSTKPVETIKTNVLGTINLLEYSLQHHVDRFLFASSVEIYGDSVEKKEKFDEECGGNINPNVLRSCYPESKRCAETICKAYQEEFGTDYVIARFSRIYGPSVSSNDTKSTSEFFFNAVNGQDIILKSKGDKIFSFCYVKDAVSGLLFLLKNGQNGEAYNISDEESELSIKDFALMVANVSNAKIVFHEPSKVEEKGYSSVSKSIMSCNKIGLLGWKPSVHVNEGILKTYNILKDNL